MSIGVWIPETTDPRRTPEIIPWDMEFDYVGSGLSAKQTILGVRDNDVLALHNDNRKLYKRDSLGSWEELTTFTGLSGDPNVWCSPDQAGFIDWNGKFWFGKSIYGPSQNLDQSGLIASVNYDGTGYEEHSITDPGIVGDTTHFQHATERCQPLCVWDDKLVVGTGSVSGSGNALLFIYDGEVWDIKVNLGGAVFCQITWALVDPDDPTHIWYGLDMKGPDPGVVGSRYISGAHSEWVLGPYILRAVTCEDGKTRIVGRVPGTSHFKVWVWDVDSFTLEHEIVTDFSFSGGNNDCEIGGGWAIPNENKAWFYLGPHSTNPVPTEQLIEIDFDYGSIQSVNAGEGSSEDWFGIGIIGSSLLHDGRLYMAVIQHGQLLSREVEPLVRSGIWKANGSIWTPSNKKKNLILPSPNLDEAIESFDFSTMEDIDPLWAGTGKAYTPDDFGANNSLKIVDGVVIAEQDDPNEDGWTEADSYLADVSIQDVWVATRLVQRSDYFGPAVTFRVVNPTDPDAWEMYVGWFCFYGGYYISVEALNHNGWGNSYGTFQFPAGWGNDEPDPGTWFAMGMKENRIFAWLSHDGEIWEICPTYDDNTKFWVDTNDTDAILEAGSVGLDMEEAIPYTDHFGQIDRFAYGELT